MASPATLPVNVNARESLPVRIKVNAGQKDTTDVKQRLDSRRVLFLEQAPLRGRKSDVMTAVMAGNATGRDRLELIVFRRRLH
jgi:hypothetical protein